MHEINFEFLVGYLEKEIERLNASKGSDAIDAVKKGMSEFLAQLLNRMKTAIRVERDRIQGARDSIDATLYALMSKSSLKFDDDFKKMLDHMCGNVLITKDQTIPPHEDSIDSKTCYAMAGKLEHTRLELQSRNAENSVRKIQYIKQNEILAEAAAMLREIAEEKERA